MKPGTYDFATVQGNTLPIVLRLSGFDATGSSFVFRVVWGGGSNVLRKSTDEGDIAVMVAPDADDPAISISTISLSFTPAETRGLGIGRVNRYEFEHRIAGTQTTILAGYFNAREGVNDDV